MEWFTKGKKSLFLCSHQDQIIKNIARKKRNISSVHIAKPNTIQKQQLYILK